jgi:sugar/nucleoside kinase (ribokinase family)
MELTEAARLGNLAAAEVIGHIGPRPQIALRALARDAGFPI